LANFISTQLDLSAYNKTAWAVLRHLTYDEMPLMPVPVRLAAGGIEIAPLGGTDGDCQMHSRRPVTFYPSTNPTKWGAGRRTDGVLL